MTDRETHLKALRAILETVNADELEAILRELKPIELAMVMIMGKMAEMELPESPS